MKIEDVAKELDIQSNGNKLAIVFPRWFGLTIVLGSVVVVAINAYNIRSLEQRALADSASFQSLARTVNRLEIDAVYTRAMLELRFPETARQLDRTLKEGG